MEETKELSEELDQTAAGTGKKRRFLPFWLLPLVMAVLCESLLHLWTAATFQPVRFFTVVAFALGFGGLWALIGSLMPARAGKITSIVLSAVLLVLFMAEYLIHDAFQSFMAPGTMGAGAGGVMTNFLSVVLGAIGRNWWRILLLLLPIVAFTFFGRTSRATWKGWASLLAVAIVGFGIACVLTWCVGVDSDKLGAAYSFDGAVRAFGLETAISAELIGDPSVAGKELDFELPETTVSTAPSTEDVTEETSVEEEPAPEPQPHAYDLDFSALAESEANENIAALNSYVASLTPAMENEYTGLFAGKNLIFISAEAFNGVIIDPKLTPTLYRMATKGIQFTDYYQPLWGAGTIGGEYTNLVGEEPTDGSCMEEATEQYLFLTIGNQLQRLGYSSAAFHNNDYTYYSRHLTHTYLGYDYYMGYGNGMEEGVAYTWPESDLEMIDFTVPMYIDKQPFSVYYMSVSAHSTYSRSTNAMSDKNYDKVADLECSETIKCYIAANLELENAMASLVAQLEAADLLDDTVIVIAADHYPYGLVPSSTWGTTQNYLRELFNEYNITDFVRDQNRLIIWSGCIEDMGLVVDEPTYSLDILPTLSNLFGLEYDSRLMIGRDVFSDEEPFVYWSLTGSWKTDKGSYLAETGTFTPNEGVEVDEDYVARIETIMRNKRKFSKGVAYYDYYDYVWNLLTAEE